MSIIIRSVGKMSSKLSVNEKFHRNYTSTYQVVGQFDASPFEILQGIGIPAYGSSYNWNGFIDLWAFAKGFDAEPGERIKDPLGGSIDMMRWMATVKHSSEPFDGSNDAQTPRENPLDDPPVISGGFSPYKRNVHRDKNGIAIENTAKFPYDPGISIDDAYDTVKISFNTATINLVQRAEFRGTVNSASIWGLDPRMAKLTRWDWQILRAGATMEYIKHNFEFLISYQAHATDPCVGPANKFGWYHTMPNSGSNYYHNATFEKKFLTPFSAKDQPYIGKLKCDGDRLADEEPLKFNVFEVELEKDFTSIPGMPNPLPGPFA